MRILIISDIHANLEALNASLRAAPAYDAVFNLGDLVGYGANPNEVVSRSQELGTVFVRGNHDKACAGVTSLDGFNPIAGLAVLWTQQTLSSKNLAFLGGLPPGPVHPMEGIECVHGSARDEDEYILSAHDAFLLLSQARSRITFFGHTHLQGLYFSAETQNAREEIVPAYRSADKHEQFPVRLQKEGRYLVNPGSVGQPRDGDPRAAFALYDSDEALLIFHRVPYDIRAAQKKILAAGLPDRLAARLAEGR